MTEVLIPENTIKKSEKYLIHPLIKSEELDSKQIKLEDKQNRNKQLKSLWMKIKAKLLKILKDDSNIKPGMSITEKKERVFVDIARSGGNIFSHFPMR